jgi:hypothetical protein
MSATTLSGDDPPGSLHLSFRGKPDSDDMGVLGSAPVSRIGVDLAPPPEDHAGGGGPVHQNRQRHALPAISPATLVSQ